MRVGQKAPAVGWETEERDGRDHLVKRGPPIQGQLIGVPAGGHAAEDRRHVEKQSLSAQASASVAEQRDPPQKVQVDLIVFKLSA